MIKKYADFVGTHLNESGYKRYPNKNLDYFEEYIELTGDCAIANIGFVKEHGDYGRIEFDKPFSVRFYDKESNAESQIIKLIRKDIVALFVDDDNAENKYGFDDIELLDVESIDGVYLVAVTNKGEEIIVNSHVTCPCQTIFDINSRLEFHAYKEGI